MSILNTANIRYIANGEPVNAVVLNRPTSDLVLEIESKLSTTNTAVTDATSLSVAGTLVKRDGSANFSANIINAVDFNTTSDERLKTSVVDIGINEAHGVIETLRPVTFDWTSTGITAHGFIAQEVEQVLPNAITDRDDGYKGVSYSQIIPFLVKEIQTLNKRVQILEAELTDQGV